MSDVADILNAAADLLEPEGAWTKGALARDRRGHTVDYASPNAVRWCVGGAILAVSPGKRPLRGQALRALEGYLDVVLSTSWNDCQPTVEPVLAALRGAAEAAS